MLRLLAVLLIRGRDAVFIRAELDEAMEREIARGVSVWRARRRYIVNVLGSALSMLRAWLGARGTAVSSLDVKLGLRMLRKQPGLTVVAMLALAIGIPVGLTPLHAAIALEAPPPVEGGDRIHVLKYYDKASSRWSRPSVHDYTVWRAELSTFAALGVTTRGVSHNLGLEGEDRAAPVRGAEVTASAFDVLRVPALLGRTLTRADEVAGAPRVVVISHDLWQARMAGAADVLGRVVRIDGIPHEIVGVMPDGFSFPIDDQLWIPVRLDATTDDHGVHAQTVFGRLADGVTIAQAQAQLASIDSRMKAANPELHERLRGEIVAFSTGLYGFPKDGLRGMIEFYFFQLLALLVLTVACINIGMLFLARTAARSNEVAIRTALGASRGRVVAQLFTESLVLAVIAAGVGLIAADIVSNHAFEWLVRSLPAWIDLGATPHTVLMAMALAVFSAAIVGVIPALKVTGRSVQRNIQRAQANRSGVRFGGLSSALIIIDVMLAVATLGLAVATSEQLRETRSGMGVRADRYLSASVALSFAEPGAAGREDAAFLVARDAAAQDELVRRIVAEPDVGAVAVAEVLPGMDHPGRTIEVDGEASTDDSRGHRVRTARVDIGYFDAFEQPILSGRGFDRTDLRAGAAAVIVNTSFVERVLGGRNPVGRRIRYVRPPGEEPGPWFEIVGVVGHLGMFEINPDQDDGIYHPLMPGSLAAEARLGDEPSSRHPLRLAIRTDTDAETFVPRLRSIVGAIDPAALVPGAQRLDEVFSFDRYTIAWVRLGAIALVGILLALSSSGIYALMSFTVSERTREIGIRAALGEQRRRLVVTIARRAVMQLGTGVALGLLILGVLLRDMNESLRRPVWELTIMSAGVGISVIFFIGLFACLAPTLRALRITPTEALRGG